MVRSPCYGQVSNTNVKKGPWTPDEDEKLVDYVSKNGHSNWRALPKLAGLNRCGKSCRLRWINYLRPDIKRGRFLEDEERLIINLHAALGNKWSKIATHLPGRTDNEIKNYWNTCLRKKLLQMGIDPKTHKPRTDLTHLLTLSKLVCAPQFGNNFFNNYPSSSSVPLDSILKIHLLQNMLQIMNPKSVPNIDNIFKVANSSVSGDFTSIPQNVMNHSGSIPQANAGFRLSSGNQLLTENELGMIKTDGSWDILDEIQLPVLVSVSPEDSNSKQTAGVKTSMACNYDQMSEIPTSVSGTPEISGLNQTGTNPVSKNVTGADIFENWEKLIEDDSSDNCWKTFLDLTSSSSSPVAW